MYTEICAICRDDISGFPTSTLPECGHTFHSECLITWFRSPRDWNFSGKNCTGTCPLCRHTPSRIFSHQTLAGRVSLLRRLARKKNIHPEVKKTYIRLRQTEKIYRASVKNLSEFRKKNKDLLSQFLKLRMDIRKQRRKVWKVKQELSTFDPLAVQCLLEEHYYH